MAGPSGSGQPASDEPGIVSQWRTNSIGFAGLILSVVQLLMHGTWIAVTEALAASGDLAEATATSWQAWVILALLVASGVATMIALFLSLQGSIRGRPRTPAIVGLVLSFFTGALVTFVLLLTALTSGAQL